MKQCGTSPKEHGDHGGGRGCRGRQHNPTAHPEQQPHPGGRQRQGRAQWAGAAKERKSLWGCVGALPFLRDAIVRKKLPQTNCQPRQRSQAPNAALRLPGILHGHRGILLFKARFEFTLLRLLTLFTKPQWRTQSNRFTSWGR